MINKISNLFKSYYPLIILVIILFFFFKTCTKNKNNRIELEKNHEFTIGQIIGVTGGRHSDVLFRYYVNGKEYVNGELSRSKKSFDIYGFYLVKYHETNPNNSEILISKGKYQYTKILNKNISITGQIDKITKYRDNYYDLKISYLYDDCKYSFKSRLTIDDLNCDPNLDCLKSNIELKISSIYPGLNNLYILSVDRTKKIKSDFKINVEFECN